MTDAYDPAQFMVDNTLKAITLVGLSIRGRGDDLEEAMLRLSSAQMLGVLRAALAVAGQEMVTARGEAHALAFTAQASSQ